jgi:hypothetical protein
VSFKNTGVSDKRNYIQAETIYNKLDDEKVLRDKIDSIGYITIINVPKANAKIFIYIIYK